MLPRLMLAFLLVTAACGSGDGRSGPDAAADPAPETASPATSPAQTITTVTNAPAGGGGCADVIGVVVRESAGSFTFVVTVRSADTGWDKYADAWEVRAVDGSVLGTRELLHPHETEQPFTRSLGGVAVPDGLASVMVAARDSVLGFCGQTMTIAVPSR